jgi:hypothetical protein
VSVFSFTASVPVNLWSVRQTETIQNKIRQTLLGYTYLATCNEVLANADDAEATEVSILYDKRVFSETGALFPPLHEVHRGPALVFYNDGVFTEKDWEGLRMLGVGGKTDRKSIGRFGLGALTFCTWLLPSSDNIANTVPSRPLVNPELSSLLKLFTITFKTDVPLIVSGNYALFLDPSGEHLPPNAKGGPRLGLKIDLRKCDNGKSVG